MKVTSDKLRYEYVVKSHYGQDGAIYGGYLFRFEGDGECWVHTMDPHRQVANFILDKRDIIKPHCNSVCFGTEFYKEGDEFPLLYANVYNNYNGQPDSKAGMCCVYRVIHENDTFTTELVQIIKIGFVDNFELWRSKEDMSDIRPFGNFIVDTDRNKYYAFVMRDKHQTTRFFEFDMPRLTDGEYDGTYGVNVVTLSENDIMSHFDCEYSHYLQGACYYEGKIFSVCGGTVPQGDGKKYPHQPKLLVVDLINKKQLASFFFFDIGLDWEPEFIEAYQNNLYYSDGRGHIFRMIFE